METIIVKELRDSSNANYKLIVSEPFVASDGVKHPSRFTPISNEDVEALDLKVGDKVAIKF